jgi:hypothetical protein
MNSTESEEAKRSENTMIYVTFALLSHVDTCEEVQRKNVAQFETHFLSVNEWTTDAELSANLCQCSFDRFLIGFVNNLCICSTCMNIMLIFATRVQHKMHNTKVTKYMQKAGIV